VKYLFLDESGSHDLKRIDPEYPVFVLGGVIIEGEPALAAAETAIAGLKATHLADPDVILHTADIVRNRGPFACLANPSSRKWFLDDLTAIMAALDFKVVVCAIRKDRHIEAYGPLAVDPYLLSLGIVVERFCFELGASRAGGSIVVERRGGQLDRELLVAWHALLVGGTRYVRPGTIARRIGTFELKPKSANDAGLQLADLVLSPLARWILGKRSGEDTRVVQAKLRRGPDGRWEGAGLVVLPKETGRGPLRSSRP